jgi:hypothetical protein
MAFGGLETPDDNLQSSGQVRRFLCALKRGEAILPERIELPQLIKLDRYERRAGARRARAMRIFLDGKRDQTT